MPASSLAIPGRLRPSAKGRHFCRRGSRPFAARRSFAVGPGRRQSGGDGGATEAPLAADEIGKPAFFCLRFGGGRQQQTSRRRGRQRRPGRTPVPGRRDAGDGGPIPRNRGFRSWPKEPTPPRRTISGEVSTVCRRRKPLLRSLTASFDGARVSVHRLEEASQTASARRRTVKDRHDLAAHGRRCRRRGAWPPDAPNMQEIPTGADSPKRAGDGSRSPSEKPSATPLRW
jgi:hypothetical protein